MNIEEAKQVLRDAGYYVDNLWTTEDIISNLDNYIIPEGMDLTQEEMLGILDDVLTSEFIMVHINEGIEDELDNMFIKISDQEED